MKTYLVLVLILATLLYVFLGWNWVSSLALVGLLLGIVWLFYRWVVMPDYSRAGSQVFYANTSDHKQNEKTIVEAASVMEQRKAGREAVEPVTVVVKPDAHFETYSAQLNYESLKSSEATIVED